MGIAVIIPNVNYGDANLGKVTLKQGVPLRSMTIVGPDEITEPTLFTVNFFPANTSQRGIVWSIVSGATYASINAETGELTPIVGAIVNDVVIRATSTADNTIYAEKTVSVSYEMVYAEKYALVGDGTARIATLYQVKKNSRIVCDFRIDSMPTATSTAKYFTVWGSYTSEDAPVSRHLIAWISNPGSSFVRQTIGFGMVTTASGGVLCTNKNNYIQTGQRIREEISRNGLLTADHQDNWVITNADTFGSPVNPLRIFGLPGGQMLNMTLFAFQAYEGDALALNLVPCTLLENIPGSASWDGNAHNAGENGLWDKVGKMFYGNVESSGSFTVID